MKDLLLCSSRNSITNLISQISQGEIDKILLQKLLPQFEQNLRTLFFVIKEKTAIKEIVFYMKLPNIIANDERYKNILMKFFFNLLIINYLSKHQYTSFSFIAPRLILDMRNLSGIEVIFKSALRKRKIIEEFYEGNSAKNGQKIEKNVKNKEAEDDVLNIDQEMRDENSDDNFEIDNKFIEQIKPDNTMKRLTLQIQIRQVKLMSSLVTKNLTYLYMGDFDIESFCHFCRLFKDIDFTRSSQLTMIKLSLSSLVSKYNLVRKGLVDFYGTFIKSLTEEGLYTKIEITNEEFEDVANMINYNSVLTNCFEFKENEKISNYDILDYTSRNPIYYCRIQEQGIRWLIIKLVEKRLKCNNYDKKSLKISNIILSLLFCTDNLKTVNVRFKHKPIQV